MFEKILDSIRNYNEWKADKIIKSEKIFEQSSKIDFLSTGYISVTLTGYAETHMEKSKVWHKPIVMWEIEGTLSKKFLSYDESVWDLKKLLRSKFDKAYYEYCNKIKNE